MQSRPAAERESVRTAYEFAIRLFSGRHRTCGRPFVEHLVGTASVLERYGADLDVIQAGLLHAAYEQGEFPSKRGRREALRNVIGARAEELVHGYSDMDWKRVPDEATDGERDVVLIRVANEIDECGDRGLRYVGPRKRESVAKGIPGFVAVARKYGESKMGDELLASFEANSGEADAAAVLQRNGSFTLEARIRVPFRRRVRKWRRALTRKLTGKR